MRGRGFGEGWVQMRETRVHRAARTSSLQPSGTRAEQALRRVVHGDALLGYQSLVLQEFPAKRAHFRQFTPKLPLCFATGK